MALYWRSLSAGMPVPAQRTPGRTGWPATRLGELVDHLVDHALGLVHHLARRLLREDGRLAQLGRDLADLLRRVFGSGRRRLGGAGTRPLGCPNEERMTVFF